MLRLGAPVPFTPGDPDAWVAEHIRRGYKAAFCPLSEADGDDVVAAFREAAAAADLVIAEVGAWSNPLSPDSETSRKAIVLCQARLRLADRIGARCCVNITGSRGDTWDGHHPNNLTPDTFDLIVQTTREIIDAVAPQSTYYTLETMPWMYPDSAESYAKLIRAIDRERFAVHLDPVNLVNSPATYYGTAALLQECFDRLGPHIRSCHAKDILMEQRLTVHLNEVRPGLGVLDYATYLRELSKLPTDVPLMIEHLADDEQYTAAARHILEVAAEVGS